MDQRLVAGYIKFKKSDYILEQQTFEDLVEHGQHPHTLFITCSDSRVVPNLITHAKPGDLFITRNIGNFVPPHDNNEGFAGVASAIEYAICALKVKNIVVCGHSECGAIGTLYKEVEPTPNNIHIRKWLTLGLPAKEKALKDKPNASIKELRDYTEKVSALFQLENLLTYPLIKEAVEKGELNLEAWHYNIKTGEILAYSKEKNEFIPLEEFLE